MSNANQQAPIPRATYHQHRCIKKLARAECYNYHDGRCVALDDGDECVCVQSISYTLLCKWFCKAVLPLEQKLQAELFQRRDERKCGQCGSTFRSTHGKTLYCKKCSAMRTRQSKRDWARQYRAKRRKYTL